jgi:hypothetical protein
MIRLMIAIGFAGIILIMAIFLREAEDVSPSTQSLTPGFPTPTMPRVP